MMQLTRMFQPLAPDTEASARLIAQTAPLAAG